MNDPRIRSAPAIPAGAPDQPARIDFAAIREILPDLIDSLDDAVVVVDRSRHVVATNRRFVDAFGHASAHPAGRVCDDALHCPEADHSAPGTCVACSVMVSGEPQRRVRDVVGPDGTRRRWEANFSPILDSTGAVSHVVEIWRDITERSQLQAQLSHSERLAATGILAAGAAHELNNPLASILAGLESLGLLIGRTAMDAEARSEATEVLELLEGEVNRCRGTTDKLMLLAQPISGTAGWVDLNRAVSDTLSLLQFKMRSQGIEATADLAPDLPPLWGRESGIRGVCMNLMINAVQAMPEGGVLTVSTRRSGRGAVLRIFDTGPGVAPEIEQRIWDPFFTTKPAGQGTGLGLAVTHGVVTRHGGTIHLEPNPAGGACFVVDLPLAGPGGI